MFEIACEPKIYNEINGISEATTNANLTLEDALVMFLNQGNQVNINSKQLTQAVSKFEESLSILNQIHLNLEETHVRCVQSQHKTNPQLTKYQNSIMTLKLTLKSIKKIKLLKLRSAKSNAKKL